MRRLSNQADWVSYRQTELTEAWDVIVIGSGIGGLTAAALLAEAGRRVLVLERHYMPGGFTQIFRRPGFEWDVGVHYVGQVQPGQAFRRLFDHLSEGRLQWAPMPEVYDRVIIAGETFDMRSPRAAFRDDLVARFPAQAAGIDRYFRAVAGAVRRYPPYLAERVVPAVIAAALGPALRRPFARAADRTTDAVLGDCVGDPLLASVLTAQWGDYGLPPHLSSFGIHALVVDHYLDGASYPVGGAAQILSSIAPRIRSSGGQIVVRAEVEKVLLDGGDRATGVRLVDGRELRAPVVISDAGVATTLGSLVPDAGPRLRRWAVDAAAIGPSIAHVCLYLGLDGSAAELGLSGTNLWIYPTPDHRARWEAMLGPEQEPMGAYVSFPSAKDPSFEARHSGRSTIDVITLAPMEWFRPWLGTSWHKRGSEYEAFKARLQAWLLEQVLQAVPGIAGRVRHAELSTPLSTRHFTGAPAGEIYGLAHAPLRFRTHAFGPRTPVHGLYLTGQDVATDGLAGAAVAGVMAASVVTGRNLLSRLVRSG